MHTDLDAQTQKSDLQKPALLLLRRNLANKKYNLIASFHGLLNGYSMKLIYNMFLVTQSQTNTMPTLLYTEKRVPSSDHVHSVR